MADSLFDPPGVRPSPTARPQPVDQRPEWARYRPKNPVKCDDCALYLAQHNGNGPTAQTARWRRKTVTSDHRLCGPHGQIWRERDRLPDLKDGAR